jgi:hypothetical protein
MTVMDRTDPTPDPKRASSSRPFRGRWLGGVLAVSMLSAVVGSVGAIGWLTGFGAPERAVGAGTA